MKEGCGLGFLLSLAPLYMTRPEFLALAALLGVGAIGITPALADGRRLSAQELEAQALARLSLPDLRNYFEGRRQI